MSKDLLPIDHYVEHYGAAKASLPGATAPWLSALREAGLERFRALGFPTIKQEIWKYTNLSKALKPLDFASAAKVDAPATLDLVPSLAPVGEDEAAAYRLVFANGAVRPELSRLDGLPEGVVVQPLATLLESAPQLVEEYLGRIAEGHGDDQPLLALNTALMDDGFALIVPDGVEIDKPIEAVFVGGLADQPVMYHPRLLVVLGRNAKASLFELHHGTGDTAYLSNGATEIRLADGAKFTHLRVQGESLSAINVGTTHATLARNAFYDAFALVSGAALSRHEIRVQMEGEGGEVRLNGAYMLRGTQHGDCTSVVTHSVPNTSAREVYKGVADDRGRACFQGQFVVERGADQTDARMLNKTLLLSDKAEIDTKPELRIFADDVQCAHGATAGEIDHEALFYLRSRGIPLENARSLMVEAFIGGAIEEFGDAAMHGVLMDRVRAWMSRG